MKNNTLTKSLILISMLVAGLPTTNLDAASHKLEISVQNCSFAKKFAKAVMEKRKSLRPLNYYEQIKFSSPVAMEIISELEKNNRGVYCGVIGYISFSGFSDFNIPIRTMTINQKQAALNSGGGIVEDSVPSKEYSELLSKVSNLFPKKSIKEKLITQKINKL